MESHQNHIIKIGVVGLGYWGPNLLRNFSQLEGCEVAYGCDIKKDVFRKLAVQYPSTKFTVSYEDILQDDTVQAVAIATPLSTHYELAKTALERGKHVLLEKPMASSVVQCQELIDLAESKGLILMIDHTFVYTGAVKKIKELMQELGDIYYFDSERINFGLIQHDASVLWDLAAHDFSILRFLFGDVRPKAVFAQGTRHLSSHGEEMAHVTLEMESGIVAHVHASWLSPLKIRKILIGGSRKMILYDDLEPSEKVKVYDKGISLNLQNITPFNPLYRVGDIVIPKLDTTEALSVETQHFIDCIRSGAEPQTPGREGLEVVRMLEACDQSMKEGKKVLLSS
ncbi:MAG: Gfo/Idh/MocA family oxidoreductase [Parcubacteria group bacterium]|nr:Gfo/Idh/MocA family oxidoreductase [Parcubacteria group bacterium]